MTMDLTCCEGHNTDLRRIEGKKKKHDFHPHNNAYDYCFYDTIRSTKNDDINI